MVYKKLTICCVGCLAFSGKTLSTNKHVPSVTTTKRVDRKEGVVAFFRNIHCLLNIFYITHLLPYQ